MELLDSSLVTSNGRICRKRKLREDLETGKFLRKLWLHWVPNDAVHFFLLFSDELLSAASYYKRFKTMPKLTEAVMQKVMYNRIWQDGKFVEYF